MPEEQDKNYKSRSKSQYTEQNKEQKQRPDSFFIRILKRLRNVFRAVVSYLDRITGFKYGNVKPYDEVKNDPENKGKTKEDIEKAAAEKGLENPELSQESQKFEQFLKDTIKLSLNCDNISVVPKQYREDLNVLDVHVFKDGKDTVFSISPEGNGLMRRDRYPANVLKETHNYGSLADVINGAYAEFKNINFDKADVQNKITGYIEDNLTLSLQKGKIHSFMVNGVLLSFKKNGDTLICTPKYSKGDHGVFEAKAGDTIKLSISDINQKNIKSAFKNIIEYSNKDAREFFDVAKDIHKEKVFANFLNSRNTNEAIKFEPMTAQKDGFYIKMATNGNKDRSSLVIQIDSKGNVISDTPESIKQYIECAYAKYAAEYGEMKHLTPLNAEQSFKRMMSQLNDEKNSFTYTELGQDITISHDAEKGSYSVDIYDKYTGEKSYVEEFKSADDLINHVTDMEAIIHHVRDSRVDFFENKLNTNDDRVRGTSDDIVRILDSEDLGLGEDDDREDDAIENPEPKKDKKDNSRDER